MASVSKRAAVEVFVNDMGSISIRRASGESVVVIHPDEVSTLIGELDRARRKALRVGENDTDEITIPTIEYARRTDDTT